MADAPFRGTASVLRRNFLPISNRGTWSDPSIALIVERVREAMETFQRGDATADASLLRRGARDVEGWVRQLRSIGAGANAALRTAPIEPDRLWRVVEDPSAEASARAGAAVALGGELDARGKRRLRAAAKATASPKVRIAIQAAAEAEDEAAPSDPPHPTAQEPRDTQPAPPRARPPAHPPPP